MTMWGTARKMVIMLCFGILVIAGLFLITGDSEAQIIVDDDNGTWADYGTIQEAIDATASNASTGQKRIRVYEGIYYESIDIDNNILLNGNGSDVVLIEGSGSDYCIDIQNDEVTIKNVTVVGNGSGVWTHGIYDNNYDDLEIVDCVVTESSDGIRYYNADRLKITNCYVHNNSWNGVTIFQGNRARINDSVFENNSRNGFHIYNSLLVNFTNTEFNYDSPLIEGSPSIRATSHWFENTNVNGKPIYYLTNSSSVSVPTDVGQVIIANCDGVEVDGLEIENSDNAVTALHCDDVNIMNGTFKVLYSGIFFYFTDNCTVSDSYINGSGSGNIETTWATSTVIRNCTVRDGLRGIQLYFQSDFTVIDNCTFTKNGINSIYVYYQCDRTTIKNSHIMWGSGDGIWVRDSYRTTMHNVTVNNTWGDGIYVHQDSHNTTISNCTLLQNGDNGVYLLNSIVDCTISGNNIDDNFDLGIYGAASTSRLTITNNSIHEGGAQGIYLYSSDNSTIAWNEIFDNSGYGIDLASCSDVMVHHNNVANNGGSSSQGSDDSSGNTWDDDVSEGNWWSDYNGTDSGSDGVGDTPYSIDGAGGAEDRYPLMNVTSTSAPEKVPEFIPLMAIGMIAVLFAAFRRRW